MHHAPKPSMGGLAIFIGVAAGFIYLQPVHAQLNAVIIGACVMMITGILDDIFESKAIYKLAGKITSPVNVVSSGLVIDKLSMPFIGTVSLQGFGIVLTIF